MSTELDKFYGLIDENKVAMMTTRRPDGHLESRAMANQKRAGGADLWFVTADGSDKLRDIAHDPHVDLAAAYFLAKAGKRVNAAEQTWGRPCHGWRFRPNGDVIAAPAEAPLSKVE